MNKKPIAIVVASGGLDSCVTAALAILTYEVAFLHINYGHTTESRELQAFHDIAEFFGIEKIFVADTDHLRKIGGSSLTDRSIPINVVPGSKEEIPTTYVPFRNANILSVAVSWAEVIGARYIMTGMMEEDSSGYPDCREEFIHAFNKMVALGTKPDTNIDVLTPLLHMSKAEVVRKGHELGAPLHLTWSCYRFEDKACGVCDSCRIRLKGFAEAGLTDPIPYSEQEEE